MHDSLISSFFVSDGEKGFARVVPGKLLVVNQHLLEGQTEGGYERSGKAYHN